jgi:hypothetical protein
MSTTAPTMPPDIRTMRASIAPVLSGDIPRANPADPYSRDAPEKRFTPAELVALTDTFRQHLTVLVPAVEDRAERLPERHADRVAAMMCAGQARILLRAEPAETDALRGSIASRMARSVRTLCGHYDRLVPR